MAGAANVANLADTSGFSEIQTASHLSKSGAVRLRVPKPLGVIIMKYWTIPTTLTLLLGAQAVYAGDKVEAAIGGGAGGAIGAVIGEELGDRNGAIIGAAAGGAIGAAIATDDDDDHHHHSRERVVVVEDHPHGHFCPPGQAKKGRC